MTFTRLGELGSGEFGTVYLELDDAIGRHCATKVMSSAGGTDAKLIDEAALMHVSRHPHVAEVYSADFEHGVPTVRMEYFPAGSVESLARGRPLDVSSTIRMGTDAARGLHHLHSHGIVHRDVKASNLLLTETQRVKVADFGLATRIGEGRDSTIAYVPHLAPEEISRNLIGSVAADQYALALTLYRLLNGDDAFWNGYDKSIAALPRLSDWLPHVHLPLQRVIKKAAHRDATKRYASIADFRRALEKVVPAISWEVSAAPNGMQWHGSHRDSVAWTVTLTRTQNWNVSLSRRSSSGRESRVHAAARTFEHTSDAYNYSANLLTRLALNQRH